MKTKLCIGLLALFGFVNIALAQETAKPVAAEQIKVIKIGVGTEIKDKKLVGEALVFDASDKILWCWTKITTEIAPTTVKHVWYLNGKNVAEVNLDIKYSSYRTWSSKNIGPGKWEVKVLDEGDKVLASLKFTVKDSKSESETDDSQEDETE